MKPIVVVDREESRRAALKIILEPENQVLACDTLHQVGKSANGGEFRALLLAWMPGEQKRLMTIPKVEWSTDYVVPVLLLPKDFPREQRKAEEKLAGTWSKNTFPRAGVNIIDRISVRGIQQAIPSESQTESDIAQPARRRNMPDRDSPPPIGKEEAQRILGDTVEVLRQIGEGASCSVFLVKTKLYELRAYKVARISGIRQLEAVKKATGLIWNKAQAAKHLLLATIDYCQDRRYYFTVAALLDDVTGSSFDLNSYRPKTLFSWMSSRQRCNGALGKKDALDLIDYLVPALEGLSFLHRNGLAYNDVHPGNCGFFDNCPVWIDYSAITFLGEAPHEGAPWYAAVEGREATRAHDCYSAVKILVEALSGLHPAIIQPMAISEICQKHFTGLFGEVIRQIACKGLAMDPTQRYQSASELAEDLQHAKQMLLNDMD